MIDAAEDHVRISAVSQRVVAVDSGGDNAAALIGGIAAGVFVLGMAAVAGACLYKQRSSSDAARRGQSLMDKQPPRLQTVVHTSGPSQATRRRVAFASGAQVGALIVRAHLVRCRKPKHFELHGGASNELLGYNTSKI